MKQIKIMNKPIHQKEPQGNGVLPCVSGSNADNGFLTQEECSEYVRKRKEWWGSNLVGWTEEREGRFFPCFNVWD